MVSSYIPTLTAILNNLDPVISLDLKIMVVAQPSAPGAPPIPNTVHEVERITKIAPNLPILTIIKEQATLKRVLEGLKESDWVHLACHGQQHASEPLKSGLLLHDGILELSTIIKERLPKADFAFLSACQTATGDEKLAEESIHLAAGMLLAGFKGVIATTWSISDEDAPQVAEDIYHRILKDGRPNRIEAAYALHEAVKNLRESGASFTAWIPFIHIGI